MVGYNGAVYEREYPANPWKEYGKVDVDKAKLEEAAHRAEAQKFHQRKKDAPVERCGHCHKRAKQTQLGEPWESGWGTGRMFYEAVCSACKKVNLRSFHPDPVAPPGLG